MFRKIILFGLLCALVGGVFVYRIWNKPHEDIRKQKPSRTITASDMLASFGADHVSQNSTFQEVVLVLEGTPSKFSDSEEHHLLSFDEGGDFLIQAYLPKIDHEADLPDDGKSIRMLCKYSGYIINDESFLIPADIKLEPCYILD